MKKLKIAVVLPFILAVGIVQASDSPELVIKSYMQAWNKHDYKEAAEYLATDVNYYDASVGDAVRGKEKAANEVIKTFIVAVPDLSWKMTSEPVYNKDTIAFQWEFTGTNSGEWAGTPATNKKIKFDGVSFIKIKDGKIGYQGDYYDSKKLSDELMR